MPKTYYSTQTALALELARTYYHDSAGISRQYVYVATAYDPAQIHPSSNPRITRDLWCEVLGIDEATYTRLFDEDGRPRRPIPPEYPELQRWFRPKADGGKREDHNNTERWMDHLGTLKYVAQEVLYRQGRITLEQLRAIQRRIFHAQRQRDAAPVVYRIRIDNTARLTPTRFQAGQGFSHGEEFVIADVDVREGSEECEFYVVPCGQDVRFGEEDE